MKRHSNDDGHPVRTLVVDDAPMMRKVIQQILGRDERIQVVGSAGNGQECLRKSGSCDPK